MTEKIGFDEFVTVRSPRLLRLAYLLTQDHALAEDLLQTALTRSWSAWRRIEGDPEPYVRRVLVNVDSENVTGATGWCCATSRTCPRRRSRRRSASPRAR